MELLATIINGFEIDFPVTWQTELIFLFRILIGGLLGMALGFERSARQKEAGIATHFMVGCASALFTCVSVSFAESGDAARIAAQIVSGVGFLGAGMIFFRRESLRGLTTAAGIWGTSAIGMCVAIGQYWVALGTTALILLTQVLLHSKLIRRKNQHLLFVKFSYSDQVKDELLKYFGFKTFHRFKITKLDSGEMIAETVIHPTLHLTADEISHFLSGNNAIISIERLEDL